MLFLLLGPLASKKTGKFKLSGNRGCSGDDYFTSKAGCCCSFSIVPWYVFFLFICHLGWLGMRFCCVCFTGVLGSFGWFSDTQKKMGLTLKGGQWMIYFFRRFITHRHRMGKVCWNVLLRCQGKTLARYHTGEGNGENSLCSFLSLFFQKCNCVEIWGCMDRTYSILISIWNQQLKNWRIPPHGRLFRMPHILESPRKAASRSWCNIFVNSFPIHKWNHFSSPQPFLAFGP